MLGVHYQPYTVANLAAFTSGSIKVFVYGSEYQKGGSITAAAASWSFNWY